MVRIIIATFAGGVGALSAISAQAAPAPSHGVSAGLAISRPIERSWKLVAGLRQTA
jgi:hypothetical protein